MPPRRSTRSSDVDVVYTPLDPPPRQQQIGSGRKTVKRRSSARAIPTLNKRQSSLTQMQWIPSSRPAEEITTISSDEEEYQPASSARPKKRKRTKFDEKTESQMGLTQALRTMPVTAAKRRRRWEVDSQGFQVWEDPDVVVEGETPMERVRRLQMERVANGVEVEVTDWTREVDSGYESKRSPPNEAAAEVANSPSQARVELEDDEFVAMDEHEPIRDDDDAFVTIDDYLASVRSKISAPSPLPPARTPRNPRFTHPIPSSQSPASTRLSTTKSPRFRDPERSPLKERNPNAGSPLKPRGTQDSAKLQKLEIGDSDAENQPTPRPARRELKRVNTVQDSQFDDLNLDLDTDGDLDIPLVAKLSSPHAAPPVGLHDGDHEDEDEYDEYGDEDVDGDETYDPAFSALDRDAARFAAMTQTQRFTQGLRKHVSTSTTGSDEEDLLGNDEESEVEGALEDGSVELGEHGEVLREVSGAELEKHVSNSTGTDDEEDLPDEPADAGNAPLDENPAFDLDVHDDAAQQPSQELGAAIEQVHEEEEAVPSSQPHERTKTTTTIASLQPPATEGEDFTKPAMPSHITNAFAATQLEAHTEEEEGERIPSSPPPLRPSQISTVAPTQMSPVRPFSRSKESQAPLVFASPQKSLALPQTLASWAVSPQHKVASQWEVDGDGDGGSSSPLPVPPAGWGSPGRMGSLDLLGLGGGGKGKGKAREVDGEAESLLDFSLPPPPPMSSSSRVGTQGNSSPGR